MDVEQLFAFLHATQPDEYTKLGIGDSKDKKAMARQKFFARQQGEIARHSTIEKTRGLSPSFFNRDRISVKSLSMGDALEDKFAVLDQCSSVTCRNTDTIR